MRPSQDCLCLLKVHSWSRSKPCRLTEVIFAPEVWPAHFNAKLPGFSRTGDYRTGVIQKHDIRFSSVKSVVSLMKNVTTPITTATASARLCKIHATTINSNPVRLANGIAFIRLHHVCNSVDSINFIKLESLGNCLHFTTPSTLFYAQYFYLNQLSQWPDCLSCLHCGSLASKFLSLLGLLGM